MSGSVVFRQLGKRESAEKSPRESRVREGLSDCESGGAIAVSGNPSRISSSARLREAEASGDFTSRLMLLEELKSMPFGAVWDYYCETAGVPVGPSWLAAVKSYESTTLAKR